MEIKKMSLANLKAVMSRKEMKNVMAGTNKCGSCTSAYDCGKTCNSCRAGACEKYS